MVIEGTLNPWDQAELEIEEEPAALVVIQIQFFLAWSQSDFLCACLYPYHRQRSLADHCSFVSSLLSVHLSSAAVIDQIAFDQVDEDRLQECLLVADVDSPARLLVAGLVLVVAVALGMERHLPSATTGGAMLTCSALATERTAGLNNISRPAVVPAGWTV